MKNISKTLAVIITMFTMFAVSVRASSPAAEEIRILLGKMESESSSKDEELMRVREQLEAAKAVIVKMSEEPDLEQALKVRFEKAFTEAKTSVNKLTEEILAKIKEIKK